MDELGREVVAAGGVRGLVMHGMAEGVGLVDEVADGGVLRQDRDPALFLEVVRVHDPFVDLLVGADGAGLLEERVDERGLPMVDVGDDGNVADVVAKLLHARADKPSNAYEFQRLPAYGRAIRPYNAARVSGKDHVRTHLSRSTKDAQYGRVTPVQRIRGTVGNVVVVRARRLAGRRARRASGPLPPVGGTSVLTFDWEGRHFSAPCEVRRTKVEKQARIAVREVALSHRPLPDGRCRCNEQILRDIVAGSVARALDEQKANANGIPAIAAQSFQTGKGDDFVRYELRGGAWTQTPTREPRQPHGEGFTISASETETKAAMLCRAYESGDADGRRLIRTFAALSISKTEGVPTRRYTP